MTSWIVTFDVTGQAARRALTRVLEAAGTRTLNSVFTIVADDAELSALLERARIQVADSGHLLAVPLCPACDVAALGAERERVPAGGWAV